MIPLGRRAFLHGLGAVALGELLARRASAAAPPARAKSVIAVHLVGAPSQLDLFDDKPVLRRYDGQLVPQRFIDGQRFAFLRGHPRLLGTRFPFRRHGQSGMELSSLLPHLGSVADDLTLVKTVHTEEFNHAPAQLFYQTGFGQFGRPSLGAWTAYGLGSENRNLPAFVVLVTGKTAGAGNSLWGSGFLPTLHQGVQFRSTGDPILFLSNPPGVTSADRRDALDALGQLNRLSLAESGDPEIATRISQYELAFRMQTAVPELADLSREPRSVLNAYGAVPGRASFANHCLLARRLVERGVRFVQLYDADWDHHGNVFNALPNKTRQIDQPLAALVRDLKRLGLYDETLLTVGGEFGRTPMLQGDGGAAAGRDHHKDAFSILFAGGGLRGGCVHGVTDDLGYYAAEHPVHLRDVHATILHQLGVDHEQLTYRYQGRLHRLTDIGGEVIRPIVR